MHGHTLDLRMWDGQFDAFAQSYKTVRYDVRGFGKSSMPGEETYSRSGDMSALLDHLGIPHAHVVGLSMGAMVAIDFALEYSSLVDSLVLADGPPDGWKMPLAFSKMLRLPVPVARESGMDAAIKLWLENRLFAPALANPQAAPRLRQIVNDYSGWHWLNTNPLRHLDPPAVDRLEDITAPTLIIMGEHDVTDLHMIAETMRHRIPNARKVIMMGVGHMTNMEDPERFNDLVLRFLASL